LTADAASSFNASMIIQLFLLQLAFSLTQEQMKEDILQACDGVRTSSVALDYKREKLNFDLDKTCNEYVKRLANTDAAYFPYLLVELSAEFQDAHMQAFVPNNQDYTLGIVMEWFHSGVHLTHVDKELLPDSKFEVGDKVISWNQKPIQVVVDEYKKYDGNGNPYAQSVWTTWLLTMRRTKMLPVDPDEVITLKVQSRNGKTRTEKLTWKHILPPSTSTGIAKTLEVGFRDKDIFFSYYDKSRMCTLTGQAPIPEGATVVMTEPTLAYYYTKNDKVIGYYRIRGYAMNSTSHFERVRAAFDTLKQKTDVLVVSQEHSCGGDPTTVLDTVALFMSEPFVATPIRYRYDDFYLEIIKGSAEHFESLGHPHANVYRNLYNKILLGWLFRNGEVDTGDFAAGQIWPNYENAYDKPVLLLIDSFSGSGSDMFPSLMHGYKRATTFGSHSMGAGIAYGKSITLTHSQVVFGLSATPFFKPNGEWIENVGVPADIPYEYSINDILDGFTTYQRAYERAALDLIQ
jgi:hypothetical protein